MVRGRTVIRVSDAHTKRRGTSYHIEDPDDEEETGKKSARESSEDYLKDPVNLLDPKTDRFSFYLYYLKVND